MRPDHRLEPQPLPARHIGGAGGPMASRRKVQGVAVVVARSQESQQDDDTPENDQAAAMLVRCRDTRRNRWSMENSAPRTRIIYKITIVST